MPVVPDNDTFRVTPNVASGAIQSGVSAQAGSVDARQVQQLGGAIEQTGQEFAAIQVDATTQANQLRVDDSLNKLKEAALDAQYNPKTGFSNVRGVEALERPSGKSLTADYTEILNQQSNSIENGLANDAQKRAFRLHANDMLTAFSGAAEQHEGQEFQGYALSVRDGTIKNRMTEIGLNYNNPEIIDGAVRSIAAATYDQARLTGKSAEWAESQTRDMVSKAHKVAIDTALQKNDSTYADLYMKKYAKQMQPDDILAVNGVLTKELNGQIGVHTATQVIQESGPKIQTSDSDRAFNIALNTESGGKQFAADGVTPVTSPKGAIGIAQIMPATGPEAAKLAGVEWDETKFKTDEGYNRTLGKAYFNKQLTDFNGNLSQAYAAYNAGPGRTKEAIDEAKAKGEPQNWVNYLPEETQKYVAKNTNAFGIGAGQFQKPTLFELQTKVRERIGANQPERLKIALDETERQYNAINGAIKQKNEEAVATAMRGVMENGGRYTDLPANLRGALAPEDVTKVMDFGKRVALGDDSTNLYVYQQLSADPSHLKNLTDDQFFAMRSELSDADFKHFAGERGKIISGTAPGGPGDMNNEAITRTLNGRLNSMGVDPTPKDGSTDAERVGALRRYVNQSIAVEQQNTGKKMNDVDVESYIDKMFAQQTHLMNSTLFGGARLSKIGDIPSATKDALKDSFKRNGITNPTDADLLNAYWRQTSMLKKKTKTNG